MDLMKRMFGLLLSSAAVWSVPVSNSLYSYEDANRNPASVPFLLSGGDEKRFFARFSVPDSAQIISLNSFRVFVDAADDGDAGSESAGVFLGPASSAIFLGSIDDPPSSGNVYTFDVAGADLPEALARIQDNGLVPIELERCCGDMWINSVRIELDGVLAPVGIPEVGASAMLLGGSFLVLGALRRKAAA
jgi:hypothetical protein